MHVHANVQNISIYTHNFVGVCVWFTYMRLHACKYVCAYIYIYVYICTTIKTSILHDVVSLYRISIGYSRKLIICRSWGIDTFVGAQKMIRLRSHLIPTIRRGNKSTVLKGPMGTQGPPVVEYPAAQPSSLRETCRAAVFPILPEMSEVRAEAVVKSCQILTSLDDVWTRMSGDSSSPDSG